MAKFLKLFKNDEGATAIEYGLIAALIAVAAIGAMTSVGNSLSNTFNNVSAKLSDLLGERGGAAVPEGAAALPLSASDPRHLHHAGVVRFTRDVREKHSDQESFG